MPHNSENAVPLDLQYHLINNSDQLDCISKGAGHIYLLRLPPNRSVQDVAHSHKTFQKLANFCSNLDSQATICILTTPPDAASLYSYLEQSLNFQLWISVKTYLLSARHKINALPEQHATLLILTRYSGKLKHTKTRIAYTYCPACNTTTKDYGGKKHLHHKDGTLISDVWRDISIDMQNDINPVIARLRDLFGLHPYSKLMIVDLSNHPDLIPLNRAESKGISREKLSNQATLRSRLIHDDCLKALKRIPDNSIDFCFADLPYNLNKKYADYIDSLNIQEYFDWCNSWLTELARVTKSGHTCAILNIPLWSIRHFQYLVTKLNFQSWITWDELAFPTSNIMPANYAILCFSKGTARPLPGKNMDHAFDDPSLTSLADHFCVRPKCIKKRKASGIKDRHELSDLWHDIHRLKHNSRRVDHPCQLPPALMTRLFKLFTKSGEIILDCFNGAGTSTLVAAQLGRRYIGIELSAKYHKMATKRHNELKQGKDPFRKRKSVPKAKNSLVRRLVGRKYKVSKKTLQLEVKRIADTLGRIPTRQEVRKLSQYPYKYYKSYFVSWGEVCAAARTTGMTELKENLS